MSGLASADSISSVCEPSTSAWAEKIRHLTPASSAVPPTPSVAEQPAATRAPGLPRAPRRRALTVASAPAAALSTRRLPYASTLPRRNSVALAPSLPGHWRANRADARRFTGGAKGIRKSWAFRPPGPHMNPTLELLARRRSLPPIGLGAPGPEGRGPRAAAEARLPCARSRQARALALRRHRGRQRARNSAGSRLKSNCWRRPIWTRRRGASNSAASRARRSSSRSFRAPRRT